MRSQDCCVQAKEEAKAVLDMVRGMQLESHNHFPLSTGQALEELSLYAISFELSHGEDNHLFCLESQDGLVDHPRPHSLQPLVVL